jgi:hypothetical protein
MQNCTEDESHQLCYIFGLSISLDTLQIDVSVEEAVNWFIP